MSREQGVQVVRKLDGTFPLEYLPAYLSYFGMNEKEFWDTIRKHVKFGILMPNVDEPARPYITTQEVQ
jgi:hypothetical protein